MEIKFTNIEPNYTGGGIYVLFGALSNGNYFMADTAQYDVRILDSNPCDVDDEEVFLPEWQDNHLVKDLLKPYSLLFFLKALKWTLDNFPRGNYVIADIEKHFELVKNQYINYVINKPNLD